MPSLLAHEGGDVATIVTRDGRILASSSPLAGHRVTSSALIGVLRSGVPGITEYHSLPRRSQLIAVVVPVPGQSWSLIIDVERSLAYAPAHALAIDLGVTVIAAVAVVAACLLAVAAIVRSRRQQFVDRHAEVEALAMTDPLTGVANRRGLELAAMALGGVRCAVVTVDVDDFKLLNDARGHAAGDRALQAVAAALCAAVRAGDVVARVGGDEFVVLVPNVDEHGASVTADRIRASVAALDDPVVGAVRVSIGTATGEPDRYDRLLDLADDALYLDKRRPTRVAR
jgi:diguanylate cyclase (GGDEF)-like protein